MNPQGNSGNAPTHIQEAMKLEADGYAHLFFIRMTPPGQPEVILTLCPNKTVTWQGYTWETYAVNLTDYSRNSSGEMSRPKFSVGNPEGVFSRYVHARWMDNAEVIRYRVLGQHLSANVNSFLKNTWRVRRALSLSRTLAVFELGEVVDGPFFLLPGRAFYPPEFPTVSI